MFSASDINPTICELCGKSYYDHIGTFCSLEEYERHLRETITVKWGEKPQAESALNKQVGGNHYKECKIQPIQLIEANKLNFLEGCVVKRLCRHDKATGKGRQDIEKSIHELQLLLELRYPE